MGTKKISRIQILLIIVVIFFAARATFDAISRHLEPIPTEPTFSGDSSKLKATVIVPTLDTRIPGRKNVIWCASFVSAWKALEKDLVKGPVSLAGAPKSVASLNKAEDPRPFIPPESIYTAAGFVDKGVLDLIRKDLKERFPAKPMPEFPGITPNSFVAYAYLEANMKFAIPYFENHKSLVFSDSSGTKTDIKSFGIRPEDDYAYHKLRAQPCILYEKRDIKEWQLLECIIDLDKTSQPNQIILAMVKPKPTIVEMLTDVARKMSTFKKQKDNEGIGINDVLLVPNVYYDISHHFADIEGRSFTNSVLKRWRMDVAQQDISFRLDRSGAELASEAKIVCPPMPTEYVFDKPFLICMKKRDAKLPYFVMWVDNAELLMPWSSKK